MEPLRASGRKASLIMNTGEKVGPKEATSPKSKVGPKEATSPKSQVSTATKLAKDKPS